MPHNFILIGLIKLIFPEAKIIYCKRNPIDNCFPYIHINLWKCLISIRMIKGCWQNIIYFMKN